MARCTAPVRGHRTAGAAADCPACGGGYRGYSSYSAPSYSPPARSGGSGSSSRASTRNKQPRWSKAGSSVFYTPQEVKALTPVRDKVEDLVERDLRDVFPCSHREVVWIQRENQWQMSRPSSQNSLPFKLCLFTRVCK